MNDLTTVYRIAYCNAWEQQIWKQMRLKAPNLLLLAYGRLYKEGPAYVTSTLRLRSVLPRC